MDLFESGIWVRENERVEFRQENMRLDYLSFELDQTEPFDRLEFRPCAQGRGDATSCVPLEGVHEHQ
jgi:hypothetical protein